MPKQTVKNGLKAKKMKLPQMKLFLKKLIELTCILHVSISPFHFAKSLKNSLELIQSYEGVPFKGPK